MSFKDKAAKHQLAYFENYNQKGVQSIKGRPQEHWLNHVAAAKGMIFYDGYEILEAVHKRRNYKKNIPEWFHDTLRSQHIPFNFFIPFETEKELAVSVLKDLFNPEIEEIIAIEIEYPPKAKKAAKEKSLPKEKKLLDDETSFDVFISYINTSSEKGMLGIEVKYTEGGYSPTDGEKVKLADDSSTYYTVSGNSTLYNDNCIESLKKNSYRQIWRNHLLAYSFAKENGFNDNYKSVTIYHEGNTHFEKTFKEYQDFLTSDGKDTLVNITFSDFVGAILENAKTDKQREWVAYLKKRYNVADVKK